MKLFFYSDTEEFGGHEQMLVRLLNALADKNCEIVFAFHSSQFKSLLNSRIKQIPVKWKTAKPFAGIREPLKILAILKLVKLIKQQQADVCIVAQGCIEFSLKSILAAHLAKIPLVSYIPLALSMHEIGHRIGIFRDILNRFYYRLPARWITVSQNQTVLLKRWTPAPIDILPNPMDEPLEAKFDSEKSNKNDCLRLLMAGRIYNRQKNFGTVVKACALLKKAHVQFQLNIAGEGKDLTVLRQLIQIFALEDCVHLRGWLHNDELTALMHNSEVLIVPSYFESCMPLIALEAVSQGLNVIFSNRPYIKEYEIPDKFLFDAKEPNSIANCILKYRENYLLNEKSYMKSINRAKTLHSQQAFQNGIDTIFGEFQKLSIGRKP